MPFNRVSSLKESTFWVSYLNSIAHQPFDGTPRESASALNLYLTPRVSSAANFNDSNHHLLSTHPDQIELSAITHRDLSPVSLDELRKKSYHNPIDISTIPEHAPFPPDNYENQEGDLLSGEATPAGVTPCYLKFWIPGLLVIPVPEAGFLFGYLDFSFFAVLCYCIGSVVYVWDALLMWKRINPDYSDDANNPAIHLNTVGASIFIMNSLLCYLDWFLEYLQLLRLQRSDEEKAYALRKKDVDIENPIHEVGESSAHIFPLPTASVTPRRGSLFPFTLTHPSALQSSASPSTISRSDEKEFGSFFAKIEIPASAYYGLVNNFFFLVGAIIFLIQGWVLQEKLHVSSMSTESFTFITNICGGLCYLISSVICCMESYEDRANKQAANLPTLSLFASEILMIDWFGWGDLLYLLASISSLVSAFFIFLPLSDDFNCIYYIISNNVFLIDSIVYAIGYFVYLYDLRCSLFTGKIPITRTISISRMIAEEEELSGCRETDGLLSSSPTGVNATISRLFPSFSGLPASPHHSSNPASTAPTITIPASIPITTAVSTKTSWKLEDNRFVNVRDIHNSYLTAKRLRHRNIAQRSVSIHNSSNNFHPYYWNTGGAVTPSSVNDDRQAMSRLGSTDEITTPHYEMKTKKTAYYVQQLPTESEEYPGFWF